MKKGFVLLILAIALMLTACQNGTPPADPTPTPVGNSPAPAGQNGEPTAEATTIPVSGELKSLIPAQEGYKWLYDGFAEYGHEMTLNKIEEDTTTGQATYSITGEVYDASGGESGKDYHMSITYTITSDTITQRSSGEMLMDSNFESIELIKLPLEENAAWEQTVKDADGNTVNLKCVIEKISDDHGKKIYAVQYKDMNSDYYERREIQEGVGVLSFEKLYMPQTDEPFVVGYRLFTSK